MTILITGGAGYIGSHTCYEFLAAGHDLVILDNLTTGNQSLLPDGTIFYQGGIENRDLVVTILTKHKVDSVIHFAGPTSVNESVQNPLKYYENNTLNSFNFLKTCSQHQVKNFIFSSTAAVYGNNEKQVVTEKDQVDPQSPYAFSKLYVEQMIKDMAPIYGMKALVLRYFNVAGADPEGRIGQISDKASHLIKVACEVAVGKRDHLELYGTDYRTSDGTCIRDYIHVSDLAAAHLSAYNYLLNQQAEPFFDILNCGYGKGYSVKEVLNCFEEILKRPLSYVEAPRREGDVVALVAESSRLQEKTGWAPKYNQLRTIIETSLAWEKKQLQENRDVLKGA